MMEKNISIDKKTKLVMLFSFLFISAVIIGVIVHNNSDSVKVDKSIKLAKQGEYDSAITKIDGITSDDVVALKKYYVIGSIINKNLWDGDDIETLNEILTQINSLPKAYIMRDGEFASEMQYLMEVANEIKETQTLINNYNYSIKDVDICAFYPIMQKISHGESFTVYSMKTTLNKYKKIFDDYSTIEYSDYAYIDITEEEEKQLSDIQSDLFYYISRTIDGSLPEGLTENDSVYINNIGETWLNKHNDYQKKFNMSDIGVEIDCYVAINALSECLSISPY